MVAAAAGAEVPAPVATAQWGILVCFSIVTVLRRCPLKVKTASGATESMTLTPASATVEINEMHSCSIVYFTFV
jgi:hypothetical protein